MTTPVATSEVNQGHEPMLPKTPTLHKTPESNKMVFAGGKTDATRSLETVSDPIRSELPTLRELQKLNPTQEREQQIFNLERKRKRSMSFAFIQTRGTDEQKKIIEKRGSFDELKASDALFLKKKGVDLANLFLVTDANPTSSVSRDTIKEKDRFVVNFGENKKLNDVIGVGDMLPPTVTTIRVVMNKNIAHNSSWKNMESRTGTWRSSPRPGYYDTYGYIDVRDGDKIDIIKMGELDEKAMQESNEANEKWLRERRIEDMIDNDGKALTDLEEDKKLEKEAQEEIKQRKEIRESIGTMRKGRFYGTTDKPISATVKALKDLNAAETNNLLRKVFGEGSGTNLLIEIDGGSTVAIKRMIALAYHEGGLMFGRMNQAAIVDKSTGSIIRNENTGLDIGTFQIHGTSSSDAIKKYEDCLQAGIKLANGKKIPVDYEKLKDDPAQRDLIAHLGYIQLQRGGEGTFARLRDSSLMDSEVIELMHHDIQGGIRAIGESVVAQVKNTKIDLEQIKAA